ncbi:MAG: methylenetetrahydrofolate reductase C-terminal domain-containing protein [Anaerolineae bacterium]
MSVRSWIQHRGHALEVTYQLAEWVFVRLDPFFSFVGYDRVEQLIRPAEQLAKELAFDCRMCGQCILHSTGMTCPMTCPKNLRNGPCGGVRANGHCEVKPEVKCVWVQAYERSLDMSIYGHEMLTVQPPVNRGLQGTSAWVNMLTGVDREVPSGWGA